MEVEVFVVDNNSVDGSVEMVRNKFPWAKLIANTDNKGFSRANNQAMKIAEGEYILLLNPDTVVEEDTFSRVITFMDEHPDAGGLGVKMVDGKGHFLPESKRGLPTPETSFYKIFGISRIFPKSKRFNRYHLGYLDHNEIHQIEILSGAFMLMRKTALDQVGLLDEAFFMYGEDIDLSWRIVQGGWKNYYYPKTRIIHYKGESTKKGSLNYVFVFYNAMVIFAKKHFSEKNARVFSFLINVAIWIRAGVAIVNRFVKSVILPSFDFGASIGSLYLIKYFYAESQHKIYDPTLIQMAFISYAIAMVCKCLVRGGYDKPFRPLKVIRPLLIGSAVLAIAYSFLPESLRFSRAILLLGATAAILVFLLNRMIFSLISTGTAGLLSATGKRFAIVGSDDEIKRVLGILRQTNYHMGFVAHVAEGNQIRNECVGTREQLDEIIRVHDIDSVIFVQKMSVRQTSFRR
jgi:GT2 family glycosyltransferase